MREWNQGVRKRREEKLRTIRGETRKAVSPHQSWGTPVWKKESQTDELPWNRPDSWTEEKKKHKWASRLLIQSFVAFALLSGVYLVYQSDAPTSQAAQGWIAEVMQRDFNFAGVALWYEENLGGSASILPAFQGKSDSKGDPGGVKDWVVPAAGTVHRPFREGERGMVIRTAEEAPVVAAAEGWVIQAEVVEGLGKTVVVRHADGQETWYGWLKEIRVEEKDWVKPRQLLGEVGSQGEEALLFFAMKRGDGFVNPADVIPFDS
ncbi:M23 family metallopeptidase [Desmospora profundinema]|uniref:Stage IV sporulation protein FA n=1 Tax=Desmospora profundinema TaxID=1571184 RepID=A0ABU1INR2_9BACL|nr:M23 family metallopeptidase [Desmospora profundinema]MDR6226408.1 stage IV sporulation protein FA [Desmospora profundinema]